MSAAVYEPLLRFALTGCRLSQEYLGRLPNPPTLAIDAPHTAAVHIQEWAKTNEIEIKDSMPT